MSHGSEHGGPRRLSDRTSGLDGLRQSSKFRGPVDVADGHDHSNDHVALVYDSREAQFASAVPFIRQGLERGERCLYVADDNSREAVLEAMRNRGIDVNDAIESGALSVLSPAETYRRTGEFDRTTTLEFWEELLEEAKDEGGYTGLRAAAEMTWALDQETNADDLVEYEAMLNSLYRDDDYVVLCQYNRDRFPAAVIHDVIKTHPYVIADGTVSQNFYYTPPETFFGSEGYASKVDRMIGTLRERTEVKTELQERTAHLSAIIETTPECIKTVAADGTLLQMNPAGLDMVEADTASDVIGECIYDLIAPEHREKFRAFNERICRGERGTLEFDIIGLDGTRRLMETHAAPLRSPDGTVTHVALTRDITERAEREHELERALDLLEKTEHIADVGGWEIDVETKDVFWTDHIFELLEVDSDEEPSLDDAIDMYYEADQAVVEAAVANALESGEPFDVEVRIRTDGGSIRWLRLQGVPEVVDGEAVSLRGAARDITARKRREEQLKDAIDRLEESNNRLEQFAYAASHDLQEPLRMVSSYLQLIEKRYGDVLDEEGEEFIEFAVDGADRMREMIDGLLAYSRVETQGDPLEPIDLAAVVDDVLADLQVQIEEHDAEITVDDLPRVTGDASQLRQVFQNLIENAITYSGDEPPRIHVSAEREGVRANGVSRGSSGEGSGSDGVRADGVGKGSSDEGSGSDGTEWTVSVRDEGIGIDPAHQAQVFDVFNRLHSNEEYDGTGIGLALCERIVERHDGDIWVTSEPGEGTTFSVTLPGAADHDR